MKILVIDSHKSSDRSVSDNLHWQNATTIADHLNADMIWSYPSVNNNVMSGYDAIIFVHASHYAYTDYDWLLKSPNAKLFHVSNEYNLGEPRTLWMAAKDGRRYTVIANHPQQPSKIVQKYVSDWRIVNLNALCVDSFSSSQGIGCIYYGSFRKDRSIYFAKYLDGNVVTTSTHSKNRQKFIDLGISPKFISRLNISKGDISRFNTSLYIEDVKTHTHYNHLANRFYESIQQGCVPLFDVDCESTIEKSGYDVPADFMVSTKEDVSWRNRQQLFVPNAWIEKAKEEKLKCLSEIKRIVCQGDELSCDRSLPPPKKDRGRMQLELSAINL